ncbi:YdbH domain-containing protein [Altererythrobacter sp. H2]|uniref:YdbH domain-containing protein n=1 Tax=Altererythrobacter sp. H2 TaxID=3108391 RepID=UPI002B4BCD5D|nr:YdbH domain-containing protein [Altererythrobacter sp. H2]WRK97002.1 YdbH domain-containing protein [Altererythrobacter sp. H2]
MVEAEIDNPEKSLVARLIPRRKRWRVTAAIMLFLLLAMGWLWTQRERIADDVLADQLGKRDIPATYRVDSIGPQRQVFSRIVIGDPAQPDMTVERAIVHLRYGFGLPEIERVELIRPRLFGSLRRGKLSFGTLDPFLFAESDEPPGLPDLDLTLVDGRALLETDWGPVGIKAQGGGWLPGGFSGVLAATAPDLALPGCAADGATLYGTLTTATGQASFAGPVRVEALSCAQAGLSLARSSTTINVTASPTFDRFDGTASLALGRMAGGDARAANLRGTTDFAWTRAGIDAGFDLSAAGLRFAGAAVDRVDAEGALRTRAGLDRITLDGTLAGRGVTPGPGLDNALENARAGTAGTLLEPLLTKVRAALRSELAASRFDADLVLRRTGSVTSLTVPAASVRGSSGAMLLSLSRFQASTAGSGAPRFSGNVVTGGAGLPRIAGRMERQPGGNLVFRARMEDYAQGDSRLAIPAIFLAQAADGSLGFSGEARASGPLPGGAVRGLVLPFTGSVGSSGVVQVWPRCTRVRFDSLSLANLEIDARALTVCPGPGGAIVRSDGSGLKVAAGVAALDLTGRLAGTPVRLRSGPTGFAWPGVLAARDLDVELGPAGSASRFTVNRLDAMLGDSGIAGTFADADVALAAVPLDLREAAGNWAYRGGVLTFTESSFRLQDRSPEARFFPLVARDASLTLQDNVVTALATLRHPASDRAVSDVAIRHDLSSATGYADLAVAGLLFDGDLQPDMLTGQALGVIANVRGTIAGQGRIDWNADGVTSSGVFSSESLDFAAAFGPVRGASGTVRFTDLLGLTTAPGQRIRVASVNPGIEALEGVIEFELRGGETLSVSGGSWPFMGGRLTLEPVTMNFGVGEERRYVFRVEGLEAARFVQQLELGNINATGVFDGVLPIVFDEMGNGRIEGGKLDSRPPGGNVSYIGELTYEDMGAIANFAFAALRSLDYKTMEVRMDGPLTGEIVTRVRFDGVSQGEGTKQNFLTRQVAGLPIRFNVNIRAPFYQLITSIRAMYDPAFIRDPRELGLISGDGQRLAPVVRPAPDAIRPEDLIPDELPIQIPESESTP